jgi:hypothetical protein
MLRFFCISAVAILAAMPARANTAVSFNFSGLSTGEQVLGYFAGGAGSLGSGPGPNYGITFSPNATIISGRAGNLLTANGTMVMNVGTEFATSFKLGYVTLTPEVVSVWSGYNGSGFLLATMTLMPNSWCHSLSGCGWAHAGEGFSGAAASVTFSGAGGQFGIGSIKLGTPYWSNPPAPATAMTGMQTVVTPEPSPLLLVGTGFAGLSLVQRYGKKRGIVIAG